MNRRFGFAVVPVTLIIDRMDICLAMARLADPELLTIAE